MTRLKSRRILSLLPLLVVFLSLLGMGVAAIALEQPSGHMAGVVLDRTGRPLPRAKVVVAGRVTRSTLAQPDGRFRFSHLPVGEYYVSARARGHEPQHQNEFLSVKEGETLEAVDFKLSRTVPSIDVANVQRVFLPGRTVRINARGNQLETLDVSLFRLDCQRLLSRDPKLDILRARPAVPALQRRGALAFLRQWQVPVREASHNDDDWFYQPVQVDNLKPGVYFIALSGQPGPDPDGKPRSLVRDSWWFQVSDVALVTKRTQETLLAWVTSLDTKNPVPGAAVNVHWAGHLRKGVTDANGLVRFRLPPRTEGVTVTAKKGESWALAQAGFWGDARALDIYAYTERPLYRRGQTVHVKALARRRVQKRFFPVSGLAVRAILRDARGDVVAERTPRFSDSSSVDFDFPLSVEAPLGDYRIELTSGDAYQSVPFTVADYRKPEYKLEVLPSQPRWVRGETAKIRLRASYFFGAPVVASRMTASVYSAPAWGRIRDDSESFFAGFTDDSSYGYWGFGDLVYQHEGRANEAGEAEFEIVLPSMRQASDEWGNGDRRFTVVAEALDDSGRPVRGQASFLVVQADLRVRVETERALFAQGKALSVGLEVLDQAGKRVSKPVEVAVYRLEQIKKISERGDEYFETRRVSICNRAVHTDVNGLARVVLPNSETGQYEIVAEVKDAEGRVAHDRAFAWVEGESQEGGSTYRYGGLQILLDKSVYRPGERARAMLIAPEPNMTVLLTEEGQEISRPRVLRLSGTTAFFDVDVTRAHQPNAWLSATVVNGLEILTAERSLNVLPEDKFLQLEVVADVKQAEPGQTVTYTVKARDWKGRPVDADVSLGVVDEAIYALEPDRTPDIRSFFHGPRWNQVEMAYSFAEDYSGGLDKFAPDPRVRAQFKDTAAWFPNLRTGTAGETSVTVVLPDNLTTWVATARAATLDTRVGAQSQRLLSTKNLLLRLEPPRFLVAGDEALIAAIVHNYSEKRIEADVSLSAHGASLETPAVRRVTVAPGGANRLVWKARPAEAGEVVLEAVLKPVDAEAIGDALRLKFPVLPRAVEDFLPLVLRGIPAVPASKTIVLPADSLPDATLEVQLQTTPWRAMAGAMEHLLEYPYACAEQTLARVVPATILIPGLSAVGVSESVLEPWRRQADKDLSAHLQRLYSMQHADGGWGWWAQDVSRPELTSHILLYLAEAKENGIVVPSSVLRKAVSRVRQDLAETSAHAVDARRVRRFLGPDVRAQALLALSRWGGASVRERERLWRERQALSVQAKAQFALALLEMGQANLARDEIQALSTQAFETETYAHWSAGARGSWHDSPTEATAWALRALLREPALAPQAQKAARWLISKNSRGYWEHTRATTSAAWALAEWWRRNPSPPLETGVASLMVNDQLVRTWEQKATIPFDSPPVWRVPVRQKSARVQLDVVASGPVAWDLTGGVSFFREADALKSDSSHGLSLERTYFRLLPEDLARLKGAGMSSFFDEKRTRDLTPLRDPAHLGEPILVRLTLRSERPIQWLCVVDPLPAGAEVLDTVPEIWKFWWSHQEARDTEMAFFFAEVPAGERYVYYILRPTVSGRYLALPTHGWAMYDPEVRARGISSVFGISE
ncbi:MAG: MG2 domain-containing protein [Candidatus Sericytochromatia bacterium]|nr:MG2 domain-containing protein [Candidatus Sericytochromatia bacterium]